MERPEFTKWCFLAQSEIKFADGQPVPLLTELLHRVCDNDPKKFHNAVDILRKAFEAGRESVAN